MAEIQLNKPLYDQSGSGTKPAARAPREPRLPRAGAFLRVGAIIIDILAIHFALLAFLKFLPDVALGLGYAGPWAGFGIGVLYFAICASPATRGQSLGKLVLQLRVADVAGPDLPFNRALTRAFVLMAPLILYILADIAAETGDSPDRLTLLPLIPRLAAAVAAGWFLGNVFFATNEPHGRSFYDRVAGSVVVTADCTPAALQEFLRNVRESNPGPRTMRRCHFYLWCSVAALGMFMGTLIWQENRTMRQLPAGDLERILVQKKELHIPGFGQPVPMGPSRRNAGGETSTGDDGTSSAHFQYRYRGFVNIEELKKNDRVLSAAAVIARISRDEVRREIERRGMPPGPIPPKVRFDIGFAGYADLLFAWDSVEVFQVQHEMDLSGLVPPGGGNSGSAAIPQGPETTSTEVRKTGETTPTNDLTTSPPA